MKDELPSAPTAEQQAALSGGRPINVDTLYAIDRGKFWATRIAEEFASRGSMHGLIPDRARLDVHNAALALKRAIERAEDFGAKLKD